MAAVDYERSGFGKYVKAKFYNASNAAKVLGVTPATVINNINDPKGGYKLFGNLYQELLENKALLESVQSMYATLAKKYNELVAGTVTDEAKLKEYLNKE